MVHLQSQTGEPDSKLEGDKNENLPESQDNLDPLRFHEDLDVIAFASLGDVTKYYFDHIATLRGRFGVLLFLYSVILSRVSLVLCGIVTAYTIFFCLCYGICCEN